MKTPKAHTGPLNPRKIGVAVECTTCKQRKAPRGRSAPLGLHLCTLMTCDGYDQEPLPGSLWPGESEADFGYKVGDAGTKVVQSGAEGGA